MDDLVEFYTSILPLASLSSGDGGKVQFAFGDVSQEFLVGGSPLLLPTPAVIDRNNQGSVIFHPLAEITQKGESDVHAAFRKAVNITLNSTLRTIILTLISAAKGKVKELEQIPHIHLGLLGLLKDADDKMYDNISRMFKKIPFEDVTRSLVNIYIKPQATIDGTNYRRGSIVTFPLYDDLVNKPEVLFGTHMRKTMDPQALRGLLEYIFPDIKTEGMYSSGSMSDYYPTLDAFLRSVYKVWVRVNSIIDVVSTVDPELKTNAVSLEWKKLLDTSEKLIYWSKRVPVQPGSISTPVSTPVSAQLAFNQQLGQQQQPTPTFQQPVARNNNAGGGNSKLAEMINRHNTGGGGNASGFTQQQPFGHQVQNNNGFGGVQPAFGGFQQNRQQPTFGGFQQNPHMNNGRGF